MTTRTDNENQEMELLEPRGAHNDAGYLRLKYSAITGRYCTDIIVVRREYRRMGIGSALLNYAAQLLGYTPDPEAILPNASAPAFWQAHGFNSGFNQAALEA